jgi:hypothetical protein
MYLFDQCFISLTFFLSFFFLFFFLATAAAAAAAAMLGFNGDLVTNGERKDDDPIFDIDDGGTAEEGKRRKEVGWTLQITELER